MGLNISYIRAEKFSRFEMEVSVQSAYQILVKSASSLRPQLQQLDNDIFPDAGPYPGKLIEITGNPNSGKSVLLMEIMARAILPPHFGGKDSEVLFFNNDSKFQLVQFLRVMEKIASLTGESKDTSEIKETVENSLKHLHVYNCYSAEEFQLAVMSLNEMLVDNNAISLVAVDSLSAFYWLECKDGAVKMETHYKKAVEMLKTLCREFNLVGAYTRPSYYASKYTGGKLADYTYEIEEISEGLKGFQMTIFTSDSEINKFFTVDTFGMKVIG